MTSRTEYGTQTPKKSTLFSGQYLRNRSTLDIGVLGYIGIVWPKEHSPHVWSVPPVTPCIIFLVLNYYTHFELDFHRDINSWPWITVSPCTLKCVLWPSLTASVQNLCLAKLLTAKRRHRRWYMEEWEYGDQWRENNDRRKIQYPYKYLPPIVPDTYVVSHSQIAPANHFPLLTDILWFTQFKLGNFKMRNFKRSKEIKSKHF